MSGASLAMVALLGAVLCQCSSSTAHGTTGDDVDANACFPDSDGLNGGAHTISLTVDDTGFSKTVVNTENDATVTLTLTNAGTMPHGFQVGCVSVLPAFPNLPAGCSTMSCFPSDSAIAPIAPGTSTTITFFTPTPDGLLYPFQSSAPNDGSVPGLNNGQWSLM